MIDLFAGCGGLTQGFRETGAFTPVAAVEHDLYAAATYAANFGEDHVHYGDITDWLGGDLPEADVVVGGPPCQGFSNLGAKKKDDDRNDLWERYASALEIVQPKVFLLENVDRFLKTRQFERFKTEITTGRLGNYRIDFAVLKAPDFGAAQMRRRAIVIGTRRHPRHDPIPIPLPQTEWRTVKDVLGDLDPKIPDERIEPPAGRELSVFGRTVPGTYLSSELHLTRTYTPLSQERFRHIPPGGNRFDLPDRLKSDCWKRHTSGASDVFGRLAWHKPSVTIRTEFYKPEKGRYLHPDENRALSHLEAARIQGFPDDFKWCGPKRAIARQIGNAVPVPLATALAEHIAEYLGDW